MFQSEERHVCFCFCFFVFLKSNRLLFVSDCQLEWSNHLAHSEAIQKTTTQKKRNTPYSSACLDTPHPHMEQLGGLGIPNTVLSMLCAS